MITTGYLFVCVNICKLAATNDWSNSHIDFELPPGVKNDNYRALFLCINICMMAAIGMAQELKLLIKEAIDF